MIELIFAIVIMGIALLSAPMLVSTASSSSRVSFQQESIAMLASHTNALLSYAWDEQDTESVNNDSILDTNSTVAAFNDRNISSPFLGRLRFLPPGGSALDATPSASFGSGVEENATLSDDVDDFDGRNEALSEVTSVGQVLDGDFLDQNITVTTQVQYADDRPSSMSACRGSGCRYSRPFSLATAATRNVKIITTNLTSSNDPDKSITMQAFMCNIGTAQPIRREGI